MMRRRTFIAASLGTAAGAVSGGKAAAIERSGALYTGATLAFGTVVTATVRHADARQAGLAIEGAFRAVRHIDRLMSIYSPGSQVFQLNRDGVLANPHPDLLLVLRQARDLSVLTRGAFDITVQPLWRSFRDAAERAALPSQLEREQAASHVGWREVGIGRAGVVLRKPGTAITLNGLAQGYAADLALAALRALGIEHALLDTGEFAACGSKPEQRPWTLGVPDPRERGVLAATLRLDGRSAATSGDYESTFTPDFVHHHIFDPATGQSPRDLASVTVLAPTALLADGLSTAFMVMGARKAHALAATMPGVDLMTINKRGVIWKSPAFPRQAA